MTVSLLSIFRDGLAPPDLENELSKVDSDAGPSRRQKEGWAGFDSFYWSFITATTVGHRAMRPANQVSRLIAIAIAFLGPTLTGIMIAVALHAATVTLAVHDATALVK